MPSPLPGFVKMMKRIPVISTDLLEGSRSLRGYELLLFEPVNASFESAS